MYAPSAYNSGSSGSHFFDQSIKPNEIMEHAKSSDDPNNDIGMAKQVLQDMGWSVFGNGDKPLLTNIINSSTPSSSIFETSFVLFDNDNEFHRSDAYDWSGNGGQAHYVMGFTVSSSNQNVVTNNNISISGVSNGLSNTSSALRQLSITPVNGSSGSTTISITAADSNGNSTTESFVLDVFVPNTPPTVSINTPSDNFSFFSSPQVFSASANDEEDGVITNIIWKCRVIDQAVWITAGIGTGLSLS